MNGDVNFIIGQIGLLLAVATACGLLAKVLRIPVIFGYIISGLIIGPFLLHIDGATNVLNNTQHIAFTFLLFLVGLETDWAKAKKQLQGGLGVSLIQIFGSFAVGLLTSYFFKLSLQSGLFIGLALTFTSGVVSLKLLAEQHDLSSLHGRLASSILFIQDLIAIIVLSLLQGFSSRGYLTLGQEGALIVMKAVAVAVIFWFVSRLIIPILFRQAARSSELLFLLTMAWCFAGTAMFQYFNLPIEVGALLAGLTLASQPYSFDILSKVRLLRDFFLIFFFVNIGASLLVPQARYISLTLVLIGAVVIGRPLITYLTLSFSGYRARTSFLTALAQSSLSEFAVIFALIGAQSLHVDPQLVSAISIATLASMSIAALTTQYRQRIYHFLYPILHLSERGHHQHHALITGGYDVESLEDHTIIFGYHRMGYHVLRHVLDHKRKVLVVDFNPDIIHQLRASGVPALYGDIEDDQIFEMAQAKAARLVVSTVPHREETEYLLNYMHHLNPHIPIIVTARTVDDALHYYHLHAAYVLLPHLLSSEHIAHIIQRNSTGSLEALSKQQIEELHTLHNSKEALFSD